MEDLLQTCLELQKKKDFKKIQKMVDSHKYDDNPAFNYFIAHLYYTGTMYEKNMDQCLKYLKASAVGDYASANFMLATLYERGDGVEIDFVTSNQCLIKAAEKGYLPAVNHLGELYLMGRYDIEVDPEKAFKLFTKCYVEGYEKGKVNYAYCLTYGLGTTQNLDEGIKLLEELANKGYPEAMYNLGKVYFDGVGGKKDVIKANYYLLRATEEGHLFAPKLLGDCYYDGIGVSIDHKEAYKYYKLAADRGNYDACELVANCLVFGDGVHANYKEAINYCVKSAVNGDRQAQVSLGNRYYFGDGFRRSYARAAYWYQEAARQDDPIGLKSYGDCLVKGQGVKRNLEKAKEMYTRAIELYNYDAALPLAELYAHVKGSARNYELAVKYYELAYIYNDDEYAAYQYADLVSQGKGVTAPDHNKAAKAFEFAATKEYLPAILKAGEYYLKGIGVNKDNEKALRYYLIAADMGNEEASIIVNIIRRGMEFNF